MEKNLLKILLTGIIQVAAFLSLHIHVYVPSLSTNLISKSFDIPEERRPDRYSRSMISELHMCVCGDTWSVQFL